MGWSGERAVGLLLAHAGDFLGGGEVGVADFTGRELGCVLGCDSHPARFRERFRIRREKRELPVVDGLLVGNHLLDLLPGKLAAGVLMSVGADDKDHQPRPIGFRQRGQPRAGLIDRPSDGIQQSRHPPRPELVGRTLAGADAPLDELILLVKLHERDQALAGLFGLLGNQRVHASLRILANRCHRTAAVHDQSNVSQIGSHLAHSWKRKSPMSRPGTEPNAAPN